MQDHECAVIIEVQLLITKSVLPVGRNKSQGKGLPLPHRPEKFHQVTGDSVYVCGVVNQGPAQEL